MTEQQTRPEPDWQALRARLERTQRESVDQAHRISSAWESPEAVAVGTVVREDGNVDWREFVSHCGGILEVVKMVDGQGRPDTNRIIPLVDELFSQSSEQEYEGGVTFRRYPRNRPYTHRKPELAHVFPGDGEPVIADPPPSPRTTGPR